MTTKPSATKDTARETPMQQQYRRIKAQYPDVILMFRLGDFYEMFGDDAVVASEALEITLTARPDPGRNEKTPMCGVPYHAVDRYVARLIAKGFRVAICDQMEDPKFAKTVVRRQVTRVLTPGTVLEDAMLEAKANNYLLAAVPGGSGEEISGFGLAVCDVSTGEFLVTEIAGKEAAHRAAEEIERLHPAEILLQEAVVETWRTFLTGGRGVAVTTVPANPFPRRTPYEQLLDHFGVTSLRGFGCEGMTLAVQAAAAVLGYLKLTQIDAVAHIHALATYSTAGFMGLDATARRNLELTQTMWDGGRSRSLLSVIDTTCTAMGGRLLRKWLEQPLLDVVRIQERLDAVEQLLGDALLRGEVRDALAKMSDLERLVSRCATGTGNARDLIGVRNTLRQLPVLSSALEGARTVYLGELRERLEPVSDLAELITNAIVDEPPMGLREGGLIKDGFSEKLDRLRGEIGENREWITNLEVTERERTTIKSLKVGYNQVFGYYIEVTKPNLAYVPSDYIRKQTVANGERYITPELKERETRIQKAEEQIFELEYQLFQEAREQVARSAGRLLAVACAVAELDVLACYAETSARHGYSRPTVDDSATLQIRNGRHPVVERLAGEPFIPNDIFLDDGENRVLVITGPNMSGKCVGSDTTVFTDRGLVPIADLMPSAAPVGQFTPIDCQVRGLRGRQRATKFYRGGRQPTIKITTRLGYQIEGTPEHRVWVRRVSGAEGWGYLGELRTGDVVAIHRGVDLWGRETSLPQPDPKQMVRSRQHRLPEQLDKDLAYLLGLLIGDGTLTYPEAYALSTADEFIADEFHRINERLFGCHVTCKANGKDYSVNSKQLRLFLAGIGVDYKAAHEKHVPSCIMRAPRHVVTAFLQGLFDTDGYAAKRYGYVQLSTASERLAREVQLLLLNLGIVASRHVKQTARRPAHIVSVYGVDSIAFYEHVGFRLPRKQARAELISSIRMPNVGGIPHLNGTLKEVQARIVATHDKPVALKRNKRINSIFYTYIPSGRNISHAKLGELIDYCHESGVACEELETLQTSRYFYDRVAGVEPGEAEVYDLSVETDHAYVAGGFVSHNSTCLRQVALITLLAQAGCFVPADAAQIGLVDRIFTRVGAHDDLASGQSTFMVEMNETANILNNATERSLVILDEIGRGTSTYDGLSIAWAVAEYLQQLGAKTLFATHYHHLNDLAERLTGVKNYRVAVKEEGHNVIWLRKLVPGGTDKSYGIQVARMAGLPDPVIRRAREVLEGLERNGGNGAGLPPPEAKVAAQTQRVQLKLFEMEEHPVIQEIRRLDLTTMTPIEALTRLYELQKRAAS